MNKEYLTLEQNLCAARVFLNIFGLILEEPDKIDEFSQIKIFNNDGIDVGTLSFQNGKINIHADSTFGRLTAKYDVSVFHWLVDCEPNVTPIQTISNTDLMNSYQNNLDSCFNSQKRGELFAWWYTDIDFDVVSETNKNFSGNMQIGCSLDTQFGIQCRTHTLLEYDNNSEKIILKFMLDDSPFRYEMNNGDEKEIINISPCDSFNPFIIHRVDKGRYDQNIGYPYLKYVGIHKKSDSEENILRTLSFTEKDGQTVSYSSEYIPMNGENSSAESVIQKGLLMQNIDPEFTKKLDDIRKSFIVNGVSLFDNLIDVAFSRYSDEEVKALFGIDRQKVNYQNGADNLVDAYYGIGNTDSFSLPSLVKLLSLK